MLLTGLWDLSHRNSIMNGAEEQEAAQTEEMSTYTSDTHMHTCPEAVCANSQWKCLQCARKPCWVVLSTEGDFSSVYAIMESSWAPLGHIWFLLNNETSQLGLCACKCKHDPTTLTRFVPMIKHDCYCFKFRRNWLVLFRMSKEWFPSESFLTFKQLKEEIIHSIKFPSYGNTTCAPNTTEVT